MSILYESGYRQFRCLGSDCEATCCNGWRVDIDKETYVKYKSNEHPDLKKLFQQAVERNSNSASDEKYGVLVLDKNGDCSFMERGLCRIHSLLGPQALSTVRAKYPRLVNDLLGQEEYSLCLSCPEASRLVLLRSEGVGFEEDDVELADSVQLPLLEPEKIQAVNEIRALIIFVLQYRVVSIETRLVMLGLFLEVIDTEVLPITMESAAKLPALIERVGQLLAGAATLESELAEIKTREDLQMKIFCGMVECLRKSGSRRFAVCVQEAGEGLYHDVMGKGGKGDLTERVTTAFNEYYEPFFRENPHILENYLVHLVFQSMLPFRREETLAQYRRLIVNFLTIRIVVLGVAAYKKELTTDIVIRVVSSFARFSEHNPHYLPYLDNLLNEHGHRNFRDLFVLFAGGSRSIENDRQERSFTDEPD